MSEIGNYMEYIEELKNLENKEKERKEKARKRAKEHYYKYKETHLKAQKRWKKNNPEKVKEYEKKRYEKRKQLKQENELLHHIIKEVREYIEMHTPSDIGICGNKTKRYYTLGEDSVDHILEILDKEVN